MQPPFPTEPTAGILDRTQTTRTLSSESGQDENKEDYPTISEFFSKLAHDHPQRYALTTIGISFEAQDLFSIHEIAKFSEDRLCRDFDISVGNAQFVLEKVSKEVKRIDRINQKKRARRS